MLFLLLSRESSIEECFMNLSKLLVVAATLLVIGCDNNDGGAEKTGEVIDSAIDSTLEKVGNSLDALDQDGPMESAGEVVDEAFSKARDASRETLSDFKDQVQDAGSEMLEEAKASAQLAGKQAIEDAKENAKKYSEQIAEKSKAAKDQAIEKAKSQFSGESEN